ncbi:MAG: uroporphyrinogen-III C-methyltransferase [Desulfurivibrio sp.]|nr:uroporphyrinogen-III C-methyltransferase [Desulfurivibrio sp.]MBU4033582.1 uroporphyrinogen-III C-methyltransferase [Pseudomonadota bacterium]MBU4119802.1 uroporphyrinogen-III C-methyltransferase [Pseudomonadota bacterium]
MNQDNTKKTTRSRGKVYLIGAGPGDPTLITVKGLELLKRAEVLVYDYLATPKLLKYVPKDAELIYAGKKGGECHAHTQEEINQMLVDHASAGKIVVRLKGGDPFIFGRGGEEIEELAKHGVAFEVVPGVTSATAAATYAGVPITHRDYTASVAFITGHEDPTKETSNIAWDKISTGIGTLVFYMGIKNLPFITENLIKHGRDPETPVVVVRWASTPIQRSVVGTLATIAEVVKKEKIKPPALIVVGEVVKLRDTINWFEKRPLFGKRILVTRTREQASELVRLLEDQGADCVEGATIALAPPDSWEPLDAELSRLGDYQWLVFTSINAIRFFFTRLFELGMDCRALAGPKIAVVGTSTADILKEYGLIADLVPEEFTGEGLAASMVARGVQGCKVLLPRAKKAREVLPEILQENGAEVSVVPVYQNVRPKDYDLVRQELAEGGIDMVTFTSSSTVTNFLEMLGPERDALLAGVKVATIGPITARTAEKAGLAIDLQPKTYTIPSLVESILDFYEK